ncbi:MAG TPA: hypothetical protein VEC13_00190 [Candidatus Paceibacterota bacterium]|nr:hypothetical protein [Candidatus Paceibacterota bacterium]
MNPQQYIISQLEALKAPLAFDSRPKNNTELINVILKHLFSKKFRKYSIPEKNQKIIRTAVEKSVLNNEPIKISFPFGGYKLWRFEETPEADWAELFFIMYVARWLKQVCTLYPKGVIFTFWFDEIMIEKMNNIPESDLRAYEKSLNAVLTFVKPYLSPNMKFETFMERSRYESSEVFEKELAVEIEKLREVRAKDPQPLSEAAIRSIEMNVKLLPGQADDPLWRERIDLMHYAYYNLQEKNTRIRNGYTTENITAFTVFFEPNVIPIGSAKTSIVRFWVGVGVLEQRKDSFIENILSITQLEKAKFDWESVSIKGLEGKNFRKIRVIKPEKEL